MKAKRKALTDKSAANEGTAAATATAQEVAGCPAQVAGTQVNSNAAGEAEGLRSPAAERSANAASTSSHGAAAPDGSDPSRPVRVYADGE